MRRLPPLFLAALTTLAAAVSGLALREELRARTAGLEPGVDLVGLGLVTEGLPALVLLFLVGRLALSVMPPGLPAPRGLGGLLPAWALGHVAGVLALGATFAVESALGLSPTTAALLAPWGVVLAVRLVTLPGALVPRHALDREPPGPTATAARTALTALAVVPLLTLCTTPRASIPLPAVPSDAAAEAVAVVLGRGGEALLLVAHLLAILALLSYGLATARRAPAGRSAVLIVFALTPLVALGPADSRVELAAALLVAGGAVALATWLRRADERALVLAALLFAGAPLAGPVGLRAGCVGLVALCVATPAAARGAVARVVPAAVFLVGVPAVLRLLALPSDTPLFTTPIDPAAAAAALRESASSHDAWGVAWPLVVAALVFGAVGRLRPSERRAVQPTGDGLGEDGDSDSVGREFPALAGLLFGVVLAELWLGGLSTSPSAVLVVLAPVGTLVAGLALVRNERTA